MLHHVWWPPHPNTSRSVLHLFINRLWYLVEYMEYSCLQKSSRSSTAANRSWICNPRGRGTEFMHFIPSKLSIPFSWLILLSLLAATRWSRTYDQHWGAIPLSSNCSWCTLLQRVTTNEESDNDCSARLTSVGFQAKTNFCKCCPPSLDQEKEDDHETSDQETSTSFPKSIRVQHQPGNSSFKNLLLYFIHMYSGWL